MRRMIAIAALAAGLLVPVAGHAQIGVAARGGTLGVGGEVDLALGRQFGVRGGIGSIPVQPSADFGNVKYTIEPPSTLKNLGIDFYPGGSNFRLSAGYLFEHDISLDAQPMGTYDIGSDTYSASDVGTLTATFAYSLRAPYATLGFARHGRGLGLSMDFGAAFLGEPKVILSSSTQTLQNNAIFQQDLLDEEAKIQDKASRYMKILPIVSLAIRVGI